MTDWRKNKKNQVELTYFKWIASITSKKTNTN